MKNELAAKAMINVPIEAIILAGGLGTRLASITGGSSKVLADVGGRPFLSYLLDDVAANGICHVILAVGYKAEEVISRFGETYQSNNSILKLTYVIEQELLGTGGAILNATKALAGGDCLVLNGDTWVKLDKRAMMLAHRASAAKLTMAVAPVDDVGRFGAVAVNGSRVIGFCEKGEKGPGLINAGVYAISTSLFVGRAIGDVFSFEREVLEPRLERGASIAAFNADDGFIDIGVPEDYHRANALFSHAGDST